MISRPPSRDQPVRPTRKARRYSTTWIRGSQRCGIRTRVTRPRETSEPLATRTTPPDATTRSGVVGERAGDVQQRVRVEQRVGVDHADQRLAGRVDADVEGVGLAAVGLADQQHVLAPRRLRYVAVTMAGRRRCRSGTTIGTSTMSNAVDELRGRCRPSSRRRRRRPRSPGSAARSSPRPTRRSRRSRCRPASGWRSPASAARRTSRRTPRSRRAAGRPRSRPRPARSAPGSWC